MEENIKNIENALEQKESLGKVNSPMVSERERLIQDRDKLIAERLNMTSNVRTRTPLGYINISLDNLPSKGRFYPNGVRLQIRPASIESIKHYSVMNDNDEIDVRTHLLDIIIDNCRATLYDNVFSVEDLLEADKIYLLLAIHELTFPESENVITIKSQCPKCGTEYEDRLTKNILSFISYADDKIEKYYNDVKRCYTLKTKSFGDIDIKPPSMGVSLKIFEEFRKSKILNQYVNRSFFTILPYIYMGNTANLNDNTILKLHDEFNMNMTPKKYSLIYRSIEKIELGLDPYLTKNCNKEGCNNTFKFPFTIPDGWKSLFVIFDPFDELI